jgi:hypothetical protein
MRYVFGLLGFLFIIVGFIMFGASRSDPTSGAVIFLLGFTCWGFGSVLDEFAALKKRSEGTAKASPPQELLDELRKQNAHLENILAELQKGQYLATRQATHLQNIESAAGHTNNLLQWIGEKDQTRRESET